MAPPEATLSEVLARFERRGYRGQFAARPEGRVVCFTCRQERQASRIAMEDLYRLEGSSNPDGLAVVVALRCACGARGTLAVAYGPQMPPEEGEALRLFKDVRRFLAAS
ncbi:MAG: hypothetical protein ACYDBQ_00775 [Thermoplasmatota archaeon]